MSEKMTYQPEHQQAYAAALPVHGAATPVETREVNPQGVALQHGRHQHSMSQSFNNGAGPMQSPPVMQPQQLPAQGQDLAAEGAQYQAMCQCALFRSPA